MLTTRWKSCGGCWRGYSARAGEATHQFVIEFQNRTKCTLQCRVCINNKHTMYNPPHSNFVEIIRMLSNWPAICSYEFSTFHIAVYLIRCFEQDGWHKTLRTKCLLDMVIFLIHSIQTIWILSISRFQRNLVLSILLSIWFEDWVIWMLSKWFAKF